MSAIRAGGLDPGELTPSLANVGKEGVLKTFDVEMWAWEGRGALWCESSLSATVDAVLCHFKVLNRV